MRLQSAFLILFVSLFNSTTALSEEKIRIGVSSALSGPAAAYGEDVRNGISFANEVLGNSSYQLVIEDDQCSDRQAVSIANKLVSQDKAAYVLGFGCSGALLAAAPVYEKARTVVIASGAGAPAISNSGDYIFRTKPTLVRAAEVLGTDVAKKYKKVGVVSEETAYCQGLADAFSAVAESKGVTVVKESFTPHTEDFQTILSKMRAAGVEAIFLNPQAEGGLVSLYKQVLGLQMKIPLYGNFHPGSPTFLGAFGSKADGILFTDIAFNEDFLTAKGLQIVKGYEERYGKPKSAEHFVTLSILAFSALDDALKSGEDVKDYLYKNSFDDLVVGGFRFDDHGDVVGDKLVYVLKTIRSGSVARLP